MIPLWMYNEITMALSLSIKNVSDDVAEALRQRAARNHRSLQGELLHILETAVRPQPFQATALWRRIEALELRTRADATRFVREDRDSR
jgi:plasmid stability protein